MECLPCQSLSGEKRISPGPIIYSGKYWIVDHAYPTKLLGWLIIVLKRHAESLHDLTKQEFKELAYLLDTTCKRLHEVLNCEKEYISCFSEKQSFKHIHFHVIPKPKSFPNHLKGPKIFKMLKVNKQQEVKREKIVKFSMNLKNKLEK